MSSSIDSDHTIAFMGVEGANADLACRRLQARGVTCFTIGQ